MNVTFVKRGIAIKAVKSKKQKECVYSDIFLGAGLPPVGPKPLLFQQIVFEMAPLTLMIENKNEKCTKLL